MRNALLPFGPSHLYSFRNNIDVQMPNWDAQLNMNRKIGTGFCKAFESDNHNFRGVDDFSLPLQSSSSPITYQPANYPITGGAFRYNDGISHQPMLLNKKTPLSAPQSEADFQAIQNSKKRPIEIDDLDGLVGERTALNEWNKNKRNKVTICQQQWHHHHQFQETSMQQQNNKKLHQVPVRRSQKLSDKITALQKLVSPYGKTDTASVLQEASIHITLLQEQIQNLQRMLSSSYKSAAALPQGESGSGQVLDLRSKGLCLVPVSITQKVTMDKEGVHHHHHHHHHLATSRNIARAKNF